MNTNQQILLNIDAKVQSANAATSLRELKQLTRELQSEALKYQGVNQEAFQAAQQGAAALVDKMDDVRESINAAKGEPLEQLNSGFSLLKQSVFDLDFDKAVTGINAMSKGIKSMDVTKLGEGFTKVASSLASLGKALLTNPIFLIGTAIALLIANFDKLAKAGGIVGNIFKGIGTTLNLITEGVIKFTDGLGLTDVAGQRLKETMSGVMEIQQSLNETYRSGQIELSKLRGESTILLEYYQMYADKISIVSDKIDDFALANSEALKSTGVDLKALMEIQPDIINGMIKIPQTFIKQVSRLSEMGKEELTKIYQMYREFRTAILNIDIKLSTEMTKSDLELIESAKKSALERAKIISDGRVREVQMTRLSNNEQTESVKKQTKLEIDNLIQTQTARTEYYKEARDSQKKALDAGLITYGQYVFNLTMLNGKEVEEQKHTAEVIEKLKSNSIEIITAMNLKAADDVRKINLRADISLIEAKKANIQKELSLNVTRRENIMKNQKDSAKSAEEIYKIEHEGSFKVLELKIDAADKTFALESDAIKKKLLLYKDDKAQTEVLQKDLELLEAFHLQNKTKMNNDWLEHLKQYRKDIVDEEKKTTEEVTDERLKSLEAQRDIFNIQAEMADSELQRLGLGIGKYKLNTDLKIDLLKRRFVSESEALKKQMGIELLAVEGNEEAKQRIRDRYDEKQRLMAARLADDRLKIEQEAIQKQVENMQYASDIMNSIGDFMNSMDNLRRDESGKLDLKAQRAAFIRNKTLQTGAAVMNTAAGITNALSTQNYGGAIAIGIAGAAQIAKILATKFEPEGQEGGGGGGGSSISGGSITPPTPASAPSAPLMGQGYLNQQFNPMTFGGAVGFKPGGEQRVFVLEQDITAMQNRVKVMTGRSTLSGTV